MLKKKASNRASEFLKETFAERIARNTRYSARAFARDLGVSPGLLSLILNGKQALSVRQASRIAVLLGLTSDQSRNLVESALAGSSPDRKVAGRLKARPKDDFVLLDAEQFKSIAQWYSFAILDLTHTKGFKADPDWVAKRLGISAAEASSMIEHLKELGLLVHSQRSLRKKSGRIYFDTRVTDPTVRSFHRQMIGRALAELQKSSVADFEAREISGITLTVRKDQLVEAKEAIRRFQKEFASSVSREKGDEVYQLNIQFFPLTRSPRSSQ